MKGLNIDLLAATAALAISPALCAPVATNPNATVVDLGYTLLQGNYQSNPYGSPFYTFRNVQFAIAERFGIPVAPPNNRTIQTGSNDIQCAGTLPDWNSVSSAYDSGNANPIWDNQTYQNTSPPPAGTQEQCLFLDMVVPAAVVNQQDASKRVPVMVYVHGGGYTAGDKAGDNPGSVAKNQFQGQGYMTRSNGSVIYISASYRMGIFGFLAGDSYSKNAKTNLGTRDTRAALEWVQKYITQFGGDPDNVTIFGESAGGGMVMHQIVAYGGKQGTPFKRIIPQSPWHQPLTKEVQENVYQYTLQVANVSTFDELKALDYETMYRVNQVVIGNQRPYGLFNVGPVEDGDIIPGYYNDLLNNGQFEHGNDVLVGHNVDEGYIFASVYIKDEPAYIQWLESVLTSASKTTISYLANHLYPPVFDGSQGYIDWHGRMSATIGDMSAACNAQLLNSAFYKNSGPKTNWGYEWTLAPGYHAEDIAYTQYAEGVSSGINETLAVRHQNFLINFAKTGNPNGPGLPEFPAWTPGAPMLENYNSSLPTVLPADNSNKRCEFWATGAYRH